MKIILFVEGKTAIKQRKRGTKIKEKNWKSTWTNIHKKILKTNYWNKFKQKNDGKIWKKHVKKFEN